MFSTQVPTRVYTVNKLSRTYILQIKMNKTVRSHFSKMDFRLELLLFQYLPNSHYLIVHHVRWIVQFDIETPKVKMQLFFKIH